MVTLVATRQLGSTNQLQLASIFLRLDHSGDSYRMGCPHWLGRASWPPTTRTTQVGASSRAPRRRGDSRATSSTHAPPAPPHCVAVLRPTPSVRCLLRDRAPPGFPCGAPRRVALLVVAATARRPTRTPRAHPPVGSLPPRPPCADCTPGRSRSWPRPFSCLPLPPPPPPASPPGGPPGRPADPPFFFFIIFFFSSSGAPRCCVGHGVVGPTGGHP